MQYTHSHQSQDSHIHLTGLILVLALLLFLITCPLSTEGQQTWPCALGPVRTITFCAPQNGWTLDSPIHIVAGTAHSVPIILMQIYVDGKKSFETTGDAVDTNLILAKGTHRITVQARDTAGYYSKGISVTINNSLYSRFAYSAASDGTVSSYALHSTTGQLRSTGYGLANKRNAGAAVSWGRFLFTSNGSAGTISAFTIKADGTLGSVSGSPFACGTDCRGLAVHPSGKFLYAADFGSNQIRKFSVNTTTGALSGAQAYPAGSQPTSLAIDAGARFLFVANSGSGTLMRFAVDSSTGALALQSTAKIGSKPRSVAVDPMGRFVLVANSGSNTISVRTLSGSNVSGSPFPSGPSPVAVMVSPSGAFVYVLNSGTASISAYKIHVISGKLTLVGSYSAGPSPQSLAMDAQGRLMYVVSSGAPMEIRVFRVNVTTGALSFAYRSRTRGPGVALALSKNATPAIYVPRFLYVGTETASVTGRVLAYLIGAQGSLTQIAGSPFAQPAGVTTFALHPSNRFLYAPGRHSEPAHGVIQEYFVNQTTGALTPGQLKEEIEPLEPRSMAVEPSGRFAYAPSAGLSEPTFYGWSVNQSTGALGSWLFYAPGGNPEDSVAIDPMGRFAYSTDLNGMVHVRVINPMLGNAVGGEWISAYDLSFGTLRQFAVDASGRFAIAIDEINNRILSYRIDGATGNLSQISSVSSGNQPYALAIDPFARFVFVANRASSDISVYTLSGDTGALKPVSGQPFAAGLAPVAITVDASGTYVYVANATSRDVYIYSISSGGVLRRTLPPVSVGSAGTPTAIITVGALK